jgi:hypothetical protein
MQWQTLLEIAKDRNVSYEAIARIKTRRDIKPTGKRGRAALYDPAEFEKKETSEATQQGANYRQRFEAARAEKLEIANAKARGDLIGRVLIARVFSEIYNVDRSILLNIGPGLSGTIAAIVEEGAADRVLKIQQIIDGEIYAALGAIKAVVNKFLRGIEAEEVRDDILEPKPVRKPAAKGKKRTA